MRKTMIHESVIGLLLIFIAALIAFIPYASVRADSEYIDVVLDKSYELDLANVDNYYFKYTPSKDGIVNVSFSISDDRGARIYLLDQLGGNEYSNYLKTSDGEMIASLKGGTTYWFKITSNNSYKDSSDVTFSYYASNKKKVGINSTNFPDDNFRTYVDENFDVLDDGWISDDEITLATKIYIYNKSITTLKGIEYFTELKYLTVYRGDLTSIDLKNNKKLVNLALDYNSLTELNLTYNTELKTISLFENSLTALNVSNQPKLNRLELYKNNIQELDVRNNLLLEDLECTHNKITELDVSKNTRLKVLRIGYQDIEKINVKGCTSLNRFDCASTKIKELDVSGLANLQNLTCHYGELEKLNVSGCSRLSMLLCENSDLTELDISDCPKIVVAYKLGTPSDHVNCTYYSYSGGDSYSLRVDNKVSVIYGTGVADDIVVEIDEDHFPDKVFREYVLDHFDGNKDGFLSKCEAAATEISVINRYIKTLKGVEYFPDLLVLRCDGNQISSLDVSKNTKLRVLRCDKNELNTLILGKNDNLRVLDCHYNHISKLEIWNNKTLLKVIAEGSVVSTPRYIEHKMFDEDYDRIINVDYDYNLIFSCDKTTDLIKVKPSVSLTLDKKSASVACGSTLSLKATLKNSENKISWKSSDTKVATVDSKGKITAKMAGTVTITASAAGKSASCKVTVLYKDVTNSSDFWYAPTNYLTAKGVVKGYANQTEFRPANECTRAQMVTFLYRLQGEPKTKSNKCKFDDVKSGDYFFKPVIWAVENGITTGVSATKFEPQKVCTRAQTVTFLWRMAGKPEPGKNAKTFSDVNKKDYFYKATLWASGMKILAGYDDGTFKPQGKCLRRQMVTFLYKYDKYVNGKG